jgi:hypothetical protein
MAARSNAGARAKRPRGKKYLPPEQWKVLLLDRFPAYITWQQYEDNQRQLRQNLFRPQTKGPSLGGASLLSRIVFCGVCGRRLSPQCQSSGQGTYHCGRPHPSPLTPCPNHIQRQALDDFVTAKALEALAPAGLELSLHVIEDETARREQLETLHLHRVEQARYAAELAQRRYEQVDPGHRLVADSLEQQWEAALVQLQAATAQLEELRSVQPTPLSEQERQRLLTACADVAKLWRESAPAAARQQIVRLLIDRVEVEAPSASERARVTIRWSGGFESCHEIIRPVQSYKQLDAQEALFDRILELALAGKRSTEIAAVLESEGCRTPRSGQPISASMVMKLSLDPRLAQQLHDPKLEPDHWRSADLAKAIGVPEKRLKDWVTRGWATAIQRPFGRTWVIYADEAELARLQQLAHSQSGQGRPAPPEALRTPASVDRKRK